MKRETKGTLYFWIGFVLLAIVAAWAGAEFSGKSYRINSPGVMIMK